ncbi:unnamed protein product [Mytilus edulis]|uniref:Reverse transcriptase RNase H-like domain-containing protein n=1 Tax=Mytilus edulis TaxID=6550 RepID=A0A8S3VG41_MYTED|nr:unnamed protein product [Mytilus edulis]
MPSPTGHRWLADLASYHFNIKYRPGRTNADADGLSRLPVSEDRSDINIDSVRAICDAVVPTPFAECLAINPNLVQDEENNVLDGPSTTDIIDWKKAQQQDKMITRFITETHEHNEENKPVQTLRKRKPTKVPPTMIPDRPVPIQDYRQNESSDEESVELVIIHSDADDDSNPSVTDLTSQQGEQNELRQLMRQIRRRTGSALDSGNDIEQQENPPEDSSSSSSQTIRRSTRERRKPAWMRSGNYDTSHSASLVTEKDWYQRIQCITSLAGTNLFGDLQTEAAKTILAISSAYDVDIRRGITFVPHTRVSFDASLINKTIQNPIHSQLLFTPR